MGGEVHFKVKQSISMAKLKSYADRQGLSIASLRFLFDCRQINDNETPAKLDMEND